MAVVSDASEMALDSVIDAAFAGRTSEADSEFSKARASGSSPAAIISSAIRQVANLHKMKLAIEGGDSIEFAMKRAAPPVHFSREGLVGEALRAWSPRRLLHAMEQLAEASLEMRRNAPIAEAIAQRTLLALAVNARKKA
jgi:DNA polymerase-3 subunit delta